MKLSQKIDESEVAVKDLDIVKDHAYGSQVKSPSGGEYFIYNKTIAQCSSESKLFVSNMKTPMGLSVLVLDKTSKLRSDF